GEWNQMQRQREQVKRTAEAEANALREAVRAHNARVGRLNQEHERLKARAQAAAAALQRQGDAYNQADRALRDKTVALRNELTALRDLIAGTNALIKRWNSEPSFRIQSNKQLIEARRRQASAWRANFVAKASACKSVAAGLAQQRQA